jgi:hypothetical protein
MNMGRKIKVIIIEHSQALSSVIIIGSHPFNLGPILLVAKLCDTLQEQSACAPAPRLRLHVKIVQKTRLDPS